MKTETPERTYTAHWPHSLRRLRWKLTLAYALVTAVTLIIIQAVLLVVNTAHDLRQQQTRIVGEYLAEPLERPVPYLRADPPDQGALALWLHNLTDGDTLDPASLRDRGLPLPGRVRLLAVVDTEGRVLASAGAEPVPVGEPLSDHLYAMETVYLREAFGSRPGVAHHTIHGPDDLITAIVPLVDAPFDVQSALVARLDQPTSALLWPVLRQRAPELWPGVLATLAFAGVVGSGFGWLTARWLTRRMDRLLFAADAWRAGDFSVTADDRSADEVGHLARQMNLMAADVQTLMQVRQEVAALHERQRIARDLHDAVTQTLFSASMVAGVLPRLYARNPEEGARRAQEVAQLSRGALAEMRTLLLELRPAALQQAKLPDLLEQLALAARGRGQFATEVQTDERATLPTEAKIACYRIVQEALNNGIKHAHARHVTIALHREADSVTLRVTDDGCGFDPARVPPDRLGHQTMRERAAASGATFQLDSQPGAGTCVCVRWPFLESEEPDE